MSSRILPFARLATSFAVVLAGAASLLAGPGLAQPVKVKTVYTPEPGQERRVRLVDGQVFEGRVVAVSAETIELRLPTGGVVSLPLASVAEVSLPLARPVGSGPAIKIQVRDPNRTRYFYSPSAMTLRAGEAYFSQKMLFFSSVGYGLTDNITVLAGAVLPLWLIGVDAFNVIGAIKVGSEVSSDLHLAAGAEALIIPSFGSVGFLFGSVTAGTADAHATLSAGYPFALATTGGEVGGLLVTVSGNLRVSERLALITENWILVSSRTGVVSSAGVRWILGDSAFDLALLGSPSEGEVLPVPWVDYTYNF